MLNTGHVHNKTNSSILSKSQFQHYVRTVFKCMKKVFLNSKCNGSATETDYEQIGDDILDTIH